MAIKVGINGFGRIGRVVLRIMSEHPEKFDICGINLRKADLDYMVYLVKYVPEEAENATSVWYERYIFCLIFVCYKSMILGVFSVFDTIREKSKIVFLFFKACISDDFVFLQAKG